MELAGEGRHRRIEFSDSDSDDGAAGTTRVVLTTAKASELCPLPHRLLARKQQLTQVEDLSSLDKLDYVDLTDNSLTSLDGISGLCGLKTLIARSNRLTSSAAFSALSGLPALRVLNLAENELTDTDWLMRAKFASTLNALVINGNRVAVLDGVAALTALETLVVSHNEVEDLGVTRYLPRLKKLSVSHNRLRVISPAIVTCHELAELRVAHNRLAALPDESVLASLSCLRIFDVGHNRLTSLEGLALLRTALEQVNVSGNPVAKGADACRASVLKLCPNVQIMDGTRIAGGRRKLRLAREWKERRAARPGAPRAADAASRAGPAVAEPLRPAEYSTPQKRARPGAPRAAADPNRGSVDDGDGGSGLAGDADDDAVDAAEFMAQATSASERSRSAREQKRKRRMSDRLQVVASDPVNSVGTGGSSAWE
jgi:hypothetical protein